MGKSCPASPENIASITKGLEKSTPDTAPLQNLFVNTMSGIMPKAMRDDCLNEITAQANRDQQEHGKELMAKIGMSTDPSAPHRTVHDWQQAAQAITAADLLPTLQVSIGNDDKLITHRADLTPNETSPNGVWQTVYADHLDVKTGKRVLQFSDRTVAGE